MFHFKPDRKYTQIAVYVVATVIAIYLAIAVGSNMTDILKWIKKRMGLFNSGFHTFAHWFCDCLFIKAFSRKGGIIS